MSIRPIRPARLLCAILAYLLLSPIAAQAANPHFTAIYVFGDSYCDVGNLFIASQKTLPPSPPYYNGRFSNGPIWVEHIASAWGLPLTPSLAGGTDYAWGGALATQDVPLPSGASIPSVPHQVDNYLRQHGGKADPDALYIIEGGGNDILDLTAAVSPIGFGNLIAINLAESARSLERAGARHLLVPNLFNLALTPEGRANAAFNTAAVATANQLLGDLLERQALDPRLHIKRLDDFDLFNAIEADATHFGFTDILNPCLTTTICADPDHTLFWDGIHPTEFGHAFFAVTVEALYAHQSN